MQKGRTPKLGCWWGDSGYLIAIEGSISSGVVVRKIRKAHDDALSSQNFHKHPGTASDTSNNPRPSGSAFASGGGCGSLLGTTELRDPELIDAEVDQFETPTRWTRRKTQTPIGAIAKWCATEVVIVPQVAYS